MLFQDPQSMPDLEIVYVSTSQGLQPVVTVNKEGEFGLAGRQLVLKGAHRFANGFHGSGEVLTID